MEPLEPRVLLSSVTTDTADTIANNLLLYKPTAVVVSPDLDETNAPTQTAATAFATASVSQASVTGWTEFVASSDTRIIYVSSSTGNDDNDGLSPAKAVKTVDQGKSLIRNGRPDWLLFKRGDTFEGLGLFSGYSGRSETEMMLISTYGQGDRPLFDSDATHNLTVNSSGEMEHIAFVGLSLTASGRYEDTGAQASGVRITGNAHNVLLENLEITGFQNGIVVQSLVDSISDITIRRSLIHHNFSTEGHSQGIFTKDVDGIVIEENLFDANGWSEELGINPTKFNHGLYLQHGTNELQLINNIISRNSSHGVQARNGGLIENNLFIDNAVGAFVYSDDDTDALQTVINNVVIDASMRVLDDGNTRGWGFDIGRTSDHTTVFGNLAIHSDDTLNNAYSSGLDDDLLAGIIVYEWNGVTDSPVTANVSDPDRTVESYHQALGRSGSLDAFLDQVLEQSKSNWRDAYTADAVNDYIRAGFDLNEEPNLTPQPPVDEPVQPNEPSDPIPTPPTTPPITPPVIPTPPLGPIGNFLLPSNSIPIVYDTWVDGVLHVPVRAFDLNHYEIETQWTQSPLHPNGTSADVVRLEYGQTSGTASYTITNINEAGIYDLDIGYYDENDGHASFAIAINGQTIDTWVANKELGSDNPNTNTFQRRIVAQEINLKTNDIITITGYHDAIEYGRIGYIELIDVTPPPPLPPSYFSDNENFGDLEKFSLLNPNRWTVVEEQGERRLLLNSTRYGALSGGRLGETAIMEMQTHDDFRITVSARSNEDLTNSEADDYAIVFGYVDENNYSYMLMSSKSGHTQLFNVIDGQRYRLNSATQAGITDNDYHYVTIERIGSRLTVLLDGQSILTSYRGNEIRSGHVGLGSYNDSVYFDDLTAVDLV